MWPAIIGATASLAGTALNIDSASKAATKSYERQKDLMSLQQQYAVENWNREVNYNDPKEQMRRLEQAGLNPNLVYGNGAAGLEAPSTAAPTAPSAPMAQTPFVDFASSANQLSQVVANLAQADKNKAQTVAQDIENIFNRKVLDERIKSYSLTNNLTEAQTKEVWSKINNLEQQSSLIVAQLNSKYIENGLIKAQTAESESRKVLLEREIEWYPDKVKAEIKAKLAAAGCDEATAGQITTMLPYLVTGQKFANGTSAIDFILADKYGEFDKIAGYVRDAAGILSNWVGSGALLKNAIKPAVRRSHVTSGR